MNKLKRFSKYTFSYEGLVVRLLIKIDNIRTSFKILLAKEEGEILRIRRKLVGRVLLRRMWANSE